MPTKFWYATGALSSIGILAVILVAMGAVSSKEKSASAVQNDDFSLPSDDPQLGRRVYVRCQACHGLNGEGVAGNYPPLAGNAALQTDRAVQVVLHGMERGPAWNGQMPAFAEQLENHEIAAVITWTRQQWGNTGAVVTPNDVARMRR